MVKRGRIRIMPEDINIEYTSIHLMIERFTVIVEQGEDGYLISEVVELPGCHTQAKNYDELIERTREAIQLYLEVEEVPDIKPKFLGLQQIDVEV